MKNKIKELRMKKKLTQEELAEKLNVSRQTISKWELGETNPNINQAKEIAQIFNVSLEELLNEKRINKNIIKKIILIIVVFVYLVTTLLIINYKKILYYNISNNSYYLNVEQKNTININHKDVNDYFQYKNIKIRNDFKNYDVIFRDGNTYSSKKDDKTFSISIKEDMLNNILINSNLKNNELDKFLNDNHINNSIDLLYYSLDNKKNINIYSSIKNIKEQMIIKSTLDYYFGLNSNLKYDLYLLNGEYKGVIMKNKDGGIVELVDKNISYLINIKTNKDLDYIIDLISTIVIN